MGYVQGMNFIASSILHHTDEPTAFHLYLKMAQILSLKQLYANQF